MHNFVSIINLRKRGDDTKIYILRDISILKKTVGML